MIYVEKEETNMPVSQWCPLALSFLQRNSGSFVKSFQLSRDNQQLEGVLDKDILQAVVQEFK